MLSALSNLSYNYEHLKIVQKIRPLQHNFGLQQSMSDQQRQKKIFTLANKILLFYDASLTIACLTMCYICNANFCLSTSFLIYSLNSANQTLQHYFIYNFPLIDINKYHVAYRRSVIFICLVDMAYMLMCITFWQKSPYHPVYCYLCIQKGWGLWIGLLLVVHELFIIGWAITLINSYVTRRYYLLALGGFQVQQQLAIQRQRQLQQMMIRQPDTNPYHPKKQDKYYQFEDVAEPEEQSYVCSICLNKRVEDDHFVNAGCGHFFHQVCLLQWAQINQNCPQCRKKFKQINQANQVIQQKPEQQQEEEQYEDLQNENNEQQKIEKMQLNPDSSTAEQKDQKQRASTMASTISKVENENE